MKDVSNAQRRSFNKTLFLCTLMALRENARQHPFVVVLKKLREKERDVLERLEESPGLLTKANLMIKLEAIRVFKDEHGIA